MGNYTEIEPLKHFVLEESWVLGITASPGALKFEIDLTFAKDHPELRPPRDSGVVYGRVGLLHFRGITDLVWRGQGSPPATDASGKRDWGAIDSMHFEGNEYHLEGDWGTMTVTADAIEAEMTGPVD
jgi:hypothetical protein